VATPLENAVARRDAILVQLQSLPAPFSYAEAARHARQDAKVDSQNFARQTLAPLRGTAITP
jgi:hypothetical protein